MTNIEERIQQLPPITKENAGEILSELKNIMDMTRKEFANHFGIPESTLIQWISGRRSPSPYTLNFIKEIILKDEQIKQLEKDNTEISRLIINKIILSSASMEQ